MSQTDKIEALLEAEAALSHAVATIMRVLGADRGAEVATELVRERVSAAAIRRQVVVAIAAEARQ